jgi:hypothetical protein
MFARTPIARFSEAANRYTFWEINAVSAHLMGSLVGWATRDRETNRGRLALRVTSLDLTAGDSFKSARLDKIRS